LTSRRPFFFLLFLLSYKKVKKSEKMYKNVFSTFPDGGNNNDNAQGVMTMTCKG